ncbi:hypothetical protein EVAR_44434_1 [Eumeta japonica]|uniref:Uncharacterized protein n=1 Tax=Eumeta variegata TaxID=151549 RepID=A0A4C1WMC1_EUMVA|nr:hypothetical protein EVAR_44434_1 [Eumeta japonica]
MDRRYTRRICVNCLRRRRWPQNEGDRFVFTNENISLIRVADLSPSTARGASLAERETKRPGRLNPSARRPCWRSNREMPLLSQVFVHPLRQDALAHDLLISY